MVIKILDLNLDFLVEKYVSYLDIINEKLFINVVINLFIVVF